MNGMNSRIILLIYLMIEKLTVCALQSKYLGSALARGQKKLSRPGAKIATLLLVERRESSQHRVRESGENLVPKEHYTLEISVVNFESYGEPSILKRKKYLLRRKTGPS